MAIRKSHGSAAVSTNPVTPRRRPERLSATRVHDEFNARAYFLDTTRWFNAWPNRAVEQFEAEGFSRIRLENVETHPVWHLRMRAHAGNLTSRKVGRIVRRVVEQAGSIPHNAFFCFSPRRGLVEVTFVLDP